jgi:hypothetical protein
MITAYLQGLAAPSHQLAANLSVHSQVIRSVLLLATAQPSVRNHHSGVQAYGWRDRRGEITTPHTMQSRFAEIVHAKTAVSGRGDFKVIPDPTPFRISTNHNPTNRRVRSLGHVADEKARRTPTRNLRFLVWTKRPIRVIFLSQTRKILLERKAILQPETPNISHNRKRTAKVPWAASRSSLRPLISGRSGGSAPAPAAPS